MLRGDLLRTKTAQLSAEHHQETSRLGSLQEREAKARKGVESREERFWREVAHASLARGDSRQAQRGSPSIARALEAHRLLKRAQDEHLGLTGEVRHQVAKVLKAKVALDAFAKLQRRERIHRQSRIVEHQGEELAEVHSAHRMRHSAFQQRMRIEKRDEAIPDVSDDPSVENVARAPRGAPFERGSTEVSGSSLVARTSHITPADAPRCGPDLVALHGVHAGTAEHGPTLQVQIASAGTPLACNLTTTVRGGIGVVVEAPRGEVVQRLERERAGIAMKLSELGIKISSLEVRRGSGIGYSGGGFLRRGRRTQEERDENVIA
jgi:hypothetical protein